MITVGVQRSGSSVMVSVDGDLDEDAGPHLLQALEHVAAYDRDLMIDVHRMQAMDTRGLLHLLELHQHAERLGLRVLVVGWQPQPQQLMAEVAGIPGRGSATGERFAVAGFRRLIQQRARQARDHNDFQAGWLPQR